MSNKLDEEILRIKKLILESSTIKISDATYPNVKFGDVVKSDTLPIALLDDLQKAAASINPPLTITITTAKSDHDIHTINGRRSRHSLGTAVDIAILNGIGAGGATNSKNGNSEFRNLGNKLKDALVDMGYKWNVESGNDKAVLWQTDTGGNHYNHLHVSNMTDEASKSSETSSGDESGSGIADDINAELQRILDYKIGDKTIRELAGITSDDFDLGFLKVLSDFLKTWGGIVKF